MGSIDQKLGMFIKIWYSISLITNSFASFLTYLISSHLISSHLISSHLISISSHLYLFPKLFVKFLNERLDELNELLFNLIL